MSATPKLLQKARNSPKGVRFAELEALLCAAGFVHDRTKGSHAIWVHPRPEVPFMNVQPMGDGKAKPAQVKALLRTVDQFGLL